MKRILLTATVLCLTIAVSAQQKPAADPHAGHNHAQPKSENSEKPEASVKIEDAHDFGKIPQGKPVTYDFVLTNNSNSSYKINNVQASCGCTTPSWDKEKVLQPGESTTIKVGYNAQAEGPFSKPITITYNDNQKKVITIKGEVWKTPATSAPETKAAEIKE
jgi:hypothetical protein